MENIEQEKQNIGETLETLDNDPMLPIIIEKVKKPRKKRETQSAAQIESLRKGREILQQNRKKQREEKKQGVSKDKKNPDYMKEISDKFDTMLQTIESKFNSTPEPEPFHIEKTKTPEYTPPSNPPPTPSRPRNVFV